MHLDFSSLTASDKGTQTIYAAIGNNNIATEQLLEIIQGGTVFKYSFGSKTRGTGKSYNCICPMTEDSSVIFIGGIKWAKCNIGASERYESGYYFFWGGTQGYLMNPVYNKWEVAGTGEELDGGFCWKNAPFNGGQSQYSETEFLKAIDACPYCHLELDYDAAHAYLGDYWRMPTDDDIEALVNACEPNGLVGILSFATTVAEVSAQGVYMCWNYDSNDGAKGLLFCDGTSKLFIPLRGYGFEGVIDGWLDNSGGIWTSILNATDYSTARSLGTWAFEGSFYPQLTMPRYYGLPVRPVSD